LYNLVDNEEGYILETGLFKLDSYLVGVLKYFDHWLDQLIQYLAKYKDSCVDDVLVDQDFFFIFIIRGYLVINDHRVCLSDTEQHSCPI
jgi:hypothetical protein